MVAPVFPGVGDGVARCLPVGRIGKTEPVLQAGGRAALLPADISADPAPVAAPIIELGAPRLFRRSARANPDDQRGRKRREDEWCHPHAFSWPAMGCRRPPW